MYEDCPSSRASSIIWAWRRPDLITTSTSARKQASSARAGSRLKGAVGVPEQRAGAAEQGPVEVRVDAADQGAPTIARDGNDSHQDALGRRARARARRAA